MTSAMNTRSQNTDLMVAFGKMLDEKITPRLEKIEKSLSYALDELNKIPVLEEKVENQKAELNRMQSDLDKTNSENRRLKEQVLNQETYSRRKNIRIVGIKSQNPQNLEVDVIEVLGKVEINLTVQDIDSVHFITLNNYKNKTQVKPVILRLIRMKDKQQIMKEKQNLRKMDIIVQDDYPSEVVERRKLMLPIFFKALQLHPELNPRLKQDKIILGGKLYTADTASTIPFPRLTPENVFTPSESGVQAFFTKYSPLSNHHPAVFTVEGKEFTSSEQYIMYKMALHFKDQETAEKVCSISDPGRIKQLSKAVQGFKWPAWIQVAPDYMFDAMYAKFNQNKHLKKFLLSTARNTLVEANPFDTTWGVGLSLSNRDIFDSTKWAGKNLAGKTLERVRQTLI